MNIENILIKGAEYNGNPIDILIEDCCIKKISRTIPHNGEVLINGKNKAVIPGLVNTHTHAAMTLFRGIGDDMSLMKWLKNKIWPLEKYLDFDDVYWGTKLACLEMIKSGTTTFLDGYYLCHNVAEAIDEMGIRGMVASACFDHFDEHEAGMINARMNLEKDNILFNHSDRVMFSVAPHSIYTVSGPTLQWLSSFAKENKLLVQLHLAETEYEVGFSLERFGCTPVRYLKNLGVLSRNLVIAHGLYIDDDEIKMLADNEVSVVHNPASNMKLGSGYQFKFKEMLEAGIKVGIGTDGCSSSNNLDMIEAMKLASLLGKAWRKDPEAIDSHDVLTAATSNGAEIIGLNAGKIQEGYLADLCLIDLKTPAFTPNFNFVSNLVYAANGSCVDTVICNGKILMQDKKVDGEEEIMEQAAKRANRLMSCNIMYNKS